VGDAVRAAGTAETDGVETGAWTGAGASAAVAEPATASFGLSLNLVASDVSSAGAATAARAGIDLAAGVVDAEGVAEATDAAGKEGDTGGIGATGVKATAGVGAVAPGMTERPEKAEAGNVGS